MLSYREGLTEICCLRNQNLRTILHVLENFKFKILVTLKHESDIDQSTW
jgi:hypothetical protein